MIHTGYFSCEKKKLTVSYRMYKTGILTKLSQYVSKGQLISKCPFGVFKSPKKTTKFFPVFLP